MKFIYAFISACLCITANGQVSDPFPSLFNPRRPNDAIPFLPTTEGALGGVFTSQYFAVTDTDNLGTVLPFQEDKRVPISVGGAPIFFNKISILGAEFYTDGNLFDDVILRDNDVETLRSSSNQRFSGGRVLVGTSPISAEAGFTFRGVCTVTGEQLPPFGLIRSTISNTDSKVVAGNAFQIQSHSCKYDMCFGGDDCLLIIAGTAFQFSVEVFKLPPAFPGFIAGGTGNLNGIEGSAEILTVAGRTEFGLIAENTLAPLKPFNTKQNGNIVQSVFLVTNKPLPKVDASRR